MDFHTDLRIREIETRALRERHPHDHFLHLVLMLDLAVRRAAAHVLAPRDAGAAPLTHSH